MNFYFEAAKTLDSLDRKKGSIKGILAALPEKDRKRTAALVIQTLKYKAALTHVINEAKLLKEEKKKVTSMSLALVLVHDMLLARGIQAGDGPIKQAVLRHKTRMNGELQKLKIKRGLTRNDQLADNGDERAAQIPRYVRVNTSMWSTEDAIKAYIAKGYSLSSPSTPKGFSQDEHIHELLLFHPQNAFQEDEFYKSGKVILQDKASCFPAAVLNPPPGKLSVVIDATAAPGNKTSHLSALMGNEGKLYAFERDKKRFKTLEMMTSKAGCKNVEALNADFLTTDPLDAKFAKVTHILLDPSCSGSGIVNRLDHLLATKEENETDQEDRLQKLAGFQLLMIKHAMKFPGVQRIVYSTCSIHAAENEHVVREALKCEEAQAGMFILDSRDNVLPKWHRRGIEDEVDDPTHAASVIRCIPGEDGTNGFFVSCFVRDIPTAKRKLDATDANPPTPAPKKKKRRSSKATMMGS